MHVPIIYPVNRGEGRGGEEEKGREKENGEPVGMHRYFNCSSFIIYAEPSINYSNAQNNNNENKNMCGLSRNLLETRILSTLWMQETGT